MSVTMTDFDQRAPLLGREFLGPLRCDYPFYLKEVLAYVGETCPSLFLECYAGAAGNTLTLLLNDRVQRGMLVVGDPYLGAFWREGLKTDNLIRKAMKFKAKQANVEEVASNPDHDPAFWTLVKSQCSWQGRLDRKAYLEWNVAKAWKRETILESLSKVRSLSDRLDVIEGQGVEILEPYGEAIAFFQYPFDWYDKWNEALGEKWHSEQEQEKLFQILASRKGRWILPNPSEKMAEWSEAKQMGAAWMVCRKLSRPWLRRSILVSDRQFAADQNERSSADEKRFHEFVEKKRLTDVPDEVRTRLGNERAKTLRHNIRCNEIAQSLRAAAVNCPNCSGRSSDIRFVDNSPAAKSYFICQACGRSFRPEDL